MLACTMLVLCPGALALNPALDVSQYAHTAWKYRDGFTKGVIYDVAQTPDGYLWLATGFGLVRFDGMKPVPWEFPGNQHLPSTDVRKLFVDRDGTLWISTLKGLASWKNGKLARYPELDGFAIGRAIQDHEGSIWVAARATTSGKLCEIRNDKVKCDGENVLGPHAFAVHEDAKGNLWVGTEGLWRWKPGPSQFYSVPQQKAAIQSIVEDQDGTLLLACLGGVRRLSNGTASMALPFSQALGGFAANPMLRDRDGSLWVPTGGGGIVHFHQGRTDVFSQSDGLTGDVMLSVFEDREGSIWAATSNGLDRFRELPIVTYTTRQALSSTPTNAVLAPRDGSIWFNTEDGLNRLNHRLVTVFGSRGAKPVAGMRAISKIPLPDHRGALFEDSRGRIWISSLTGIGYLDNDRYLPSAAPGGLINALAEDGNGDLWIANQEQGLFRLSPSNEVQRIPWETFGRQSLGTTLATNPPQGGVWIGFADGGVAWFRDGRVQANYSAADRLGQGRVNELRFDKQGVLWAATDGGLSLLKDSRITTLTSKNGLPCDGVHWTMPDDSGSVWMMMPCGLVRAKLSDVTSWSTGQTIQTTLFDGSDGVSLRATEGGLNPHVAKSPDGKLWFWNIDGIGTVDPSHLPVNKLPPPVHVESVKVDGQDAATNEGLELSHSAKKIEIAYTALSFVNSERVRFKYKLEGEDADWFDAGTQRMAHYNDLKPRQYRFRVMASNNDGVWNEAGASWNFTVVPAYYQTLWFETLCAIAGIGVLWLSYRLRLHYMTQRLNLRMEERLNERTRIARDLHDTLLQSFQGVLLKFHAVSFMLPHRPEDARATLEGAIEQASRAIIEGRDAVQGLRSSGLATKNLAEALGTVGAELVSTKEGENRPDFKVRVQGSAVSLVPLVRDEIYRIAVEALRNAFRHALARYIEVDIHYEKRQIRLQVRDDGRGIDQKVLGEGQREGHHGLPGMYERAKLIGGAVAVWSEIDSGTEIELTVPASIAYAESSIARQTQ
jgi:signal transduction histidine kinase/ligand-binding sensor domain-containing protein